MRLIAPNPRGSVVYPPEFRHATTHRMTIRDMARRHDWRMLVEVGVRLAGTGAFLLAAKPDLHYLGVDPFIAPEGSHAEPGYSHYGHPDMEKWHRRALANLAPYGGRARLWRTTSLHAAAQTDRHSADCVFIDADHRTASVIADIDAWRDVVRRGGWMLGHDRDWPSVQEAVRSRFPAALALRGNVWAVKL